MPLTATPAWQALQQHRDATRELNLNTLFAQQPDRFERFSLSLNGLLFDFSKQLVTEETLRRLVALARQQRLPERIEDLFGGKKLNITEDRPALHTLLRDRSIYSVNEDGEAVSSQVQRVMDQMRPFVDKVRSGQFKGFTGETIRDFVHIGVGGSDLGPGLACHALDPGEPGPINMHFVSAMDGVQIVDILKQLKPETTAFIVTSKTFTTSDTMANADKARAWLVAACPDEAKACKQLIGVSVNKAAMTAYGVPASQQFEFWHWVGGRYSLWSSVGLSVALYLGMHTFEGLLHGAFIADQHFRTAPLEQNIPVIMALLHVWYLNFCKCGTRVVLPYTSCLKYLPDYLQQLEMESCGKSVTNEGETVSVETSAVIWGEFGPNGQHAFYQSLHQGNQIVPADFIMVCKAPRGDNHDQHLLATANCIAQSQALMTGKSEEEVRAQLQREGVDPNKIEKLLPHRMYPGNRPSSTIVLDELTPKTLGMLLALYEHKVFTQSMIWDINPFDQWGVELGKQLSKRMYEELCSGETSSYYDASTKGLMGYFRQHQE
ncbi:glucose-6-phosphate isomerase [Balneatrix alpica]|uniref:Glucose-6-phosphate isomerase n=1 Tax=Balneatrix alpica TaxID=75684 RepID=A0ABV5ZCG1_9GAMM|nr:glucose-6-phosphate isomerase [Balneatrix alpica]